VTNQISNIGGQWNLIVRRGADFVVPSIGFENADGSPVDLTGCEFAAEVRKTGLSEDVAAQFTVTIVSALEGTISMSLSASDTADFACGETLFDPLSQYVWEICMVDAAGKKSTPLWGNLNVMRQVMHA
jgi:hypothetical protein